MTKDVELLEAPDEALIWSTDFDSILAAFFGVFFGFFGSFIVWLSLVVAYPGILDLPFQFPLLVLEIVAVLVLGALGRWRNWVLGKIAPRGFVFVFRFQLNVQFAYDVALLSGIYSILALYKVVPTYGLSFSVLLAGLFFFLGAPRFIFSRLLKEEWDGRLSLLQFLMEKNASQNPRFSWLRRGMRAVEQRLRYSGLSPSPGVLFHGLSYSLFRGSIPDSDIQSLADWLIHPTRYQQVNSIIAGLIWESKQSARDELNRVVGIWERFVRLPWQNVKVTIGILAPIIVAIITQLPNILRLLGILK